MFHPQHAVSVADAVLPASGTYRVRDETTGDVMTVPERMLIRASGAVAGTPFTAYWATPRGSSALLYDVQVRVQGSHVWTPWLTATPDRFGDYTPAAAGRYAFRARARARARNVDGTLTLGWSPAAGVVVAAG